MRMIDTRRFVCQKRRFWRPIVVLTVCIAAAGQSKPPNCVKNKILPHGATDANGKTIVNVTVLTQTTYGWSGSSNGVDSTVQSALTCAINMWNNAVGSNGQGVPYVFAQTANDASSADVTINKDATPGSPVAVTANYPDNNGNYGVPSIMHLNPSSTTTDTTLCATIAHELGHVLGLSDAGSGTIMGPVVQGQDANGNTIWTNATQKIQKNDVNNVQFAATSESACKDVETTSTNKNNDTPSDCSGSPPNDSCFCDNTSNTFQCACDGSPYVCSDGSMSECIDNDWACTSVTTTECDGPSPCDGAICAGDETWDTSQCTNVTTYQCDGTPPCDTAVCVADNTWDASSCCADPCDSPSCSGYTYCGCNDDVVECDCPSDSCASADCPGYDYCTCNPADPSCGSGDGGDGGGGGGGGGGDGGGDYCWDPCWWDC